MPGHGRRDRPAEDKGKVFVMSKKVEGHEAHMQKAENLGILPAVQRPIKVVFLGAGSAFFRRLFVDVMSIPGADTGEMALVDIDEERLELQHQIADMIVGKMGKRWTVSASPDRRKVLADADYVINCIEVSGLQCVRHDNDIPAKYGVEQCIGDTIGPGGLFKALRTVPVFLEVLKDIEQLCPDAWILNYTNPMSIMCLASARVSQANLVGLCHSVQGTSHALARYADVPYADMRWTCGGINHLAWFTELRHNGQDLYPVLCRKIQDDAELYEQDVVRFDMMQHFGYFITESIAFLNPGLVVGPVIVGFFAFILKRLYEVHRLFIGFCRCAFRADSVECFADIFQAPAG